MENIQHKIKELKEIINLKIGNIDLKYRTGPSLYFYEKILERRKAEMNLIDFFKCERNLEYIYSTLVAWDMDGRGAKMKYFTNFKTSLEYNLKYFIEIEKIGTNILTTKLNDILLPLRKIYENIDIMQTNSTLVSLSKLLHFIFPDLIMPMDRSNTLMYFYNHTGESLNKFLEIFEFSYYLSKEDIKWNNIIGKQKWNTSIPKIIDNAIILKLDKSTK